jgi:thioredoxin 1
MKTLKLVKYGHEYCGPCKALKPILEELKNIFSEKVEFVEKDTYSIPMEEVVNAGIRAVPTLILLKDNVEIWRNVGLMSLDSLKTILENN